jgi:myo-inositol-1(or 4)-monophosphatase
MPNSQLLAAAQNIVHEAGRVSLEYFRSDLKVDSKKDHSLVSIADQATEKKMREIINKKFPGHEIYGEEYGGTLQSNDPIWILDPIEGTTNFLHGIPVFGNQCAVMYQGKVIVSAMFDPVSKVSITASAGNGAYKNKQKITLIEQRLEDTALLFDLGRNNHMLKKFLQSGLIEQFRSVRRFGSLITDVMFLTTSKYSCYMGIMSEIYDFAPAALILSESGYEIFDNSLTDWNPTLKSSLFACDPGQAEYMKKALKVLDGQPYEE